MAYTRGPTGPIKNWAKTRATKHRFCEHPMVNNKGQLRSTVRGRPPRVDTNLTGSTSVGRAPNTIDLDLFLLGLAIVVHGLSEKVRHPDSEVLYQDPPTGCLETLTGGFWACCHQEAPVKSGPYTCMGIQPRLGAASERSWATRRRFFSPLKRVFQDAVASHSIGRWGARPNASRDSRPTCWEPGTERGTTCEKSTAWTL